MQTAAATVETVDSGEGPVTEPRPAYLKLYEHTDALLIVRDWLDEAEGELTPEIEELLAKVEGDFDAKVERIALLVREKEAAAHAAKATADAIIEEAMRHRKHAGVLDRGAASLKEYLRSQMVQADRLKVERPLARVRVQKNSSPAVRSTLDESALAALYCDDDSLVSRKVTYAIDTKAAVDRAKRKEPLPAGVSVEYGSHVRIY